MGTRNGFNGERVYFGLTQMPLVWQGLSSIDGKNPADNFDNLFCRCRAIP
jgi:hypothetical protein